MGRRGPESTPVTHGCMSQGGCTSGRGPDRPHLPRMRPCASVYASSPEVLTTRLVWTNLYAQRWPPFPLPLHIPNSPTGGRKWTAPHAPTRPSRHGSAEPCAAVGAGLTLVGSRHRAGRRRQRRQERRLRVRARQLDLFRRQRRHRLLPRARRRRRAQGHPGRAGQRQVHPDRRREAQLDVHAERLGPGRVHLPRRDRHRHDDVSTWTPDSAGWKQLSTTFTTGAQHHLRDRLHPRLVRAGRLLRRRRLASSARTAAVAATPAPTVPGTPRPASRSAPSTSSSVALSWNAVVRRHRLQRLPGRHQGAAVDRHLGDRDRADRLTSYQFQVTATNAAGESAKSAAVTGTTATGGGPRRPGPAVPKHAVTGYWQNFNNGATVQKISDVPRQYDIIAVSFADATGTPGARHLQPRLGRARRLHRRPVQGGHQGQAGGRQVRHHLDRRRERHRHGQRLRLRDRTSPTRVVLADAGRTASTASTSTWRTASTPPT